jgi:exodeoxyribonuclease VIII
MSAAVAIQQQSTFGNWRDSIQEAYRSDGTPTFMDAKGELIAGIYVNMSNETYHSLPADSSSAIKTFAKGRHHYFRQYISEYKRELSTQQVKTFDAGTFGHMLVLEEHNFHGNYFRMPVAEDAPNTNFLNTIEDLKGWLQEHALAVSGTKSVLIQRVLEADANAPVFDAWRDNQIAKILDTVYDVYLRTDADIRDYAVMQLGAADNLNRDQYIAYINEQRPSVRIWEHLVDKHFIAPDVWDAAFRVQKSTRAHPKANWLFQDGYPEISLIAKCPKTGRWLKVRFDWLRFDAIAVDLKTTATTNPTKFSYQFKDLHYGIQAAFYTYVANLLDVPVKHFVFVATEYKDADNCEVFDLTDRRKLADRRELDELLDELALALQTNNWYGHDKNRTVWMID